jgi:hypothetical protein
MSLTWDVNRMSLRIGAFPTGDATCEGRRASPSLAETHLVPAYRLKTGRVLEVLLGRWVCRDQREGRISAIRVLSSEGERQDLVVPRRERSVTFTFMALWIEGDKMSEHETQRAEVEIGRCHVCAQLFQTQEDLLRHLKEAHGVRSLLQPPPT